MSAQPSSARLPWSAILIAGALGLAGIGLLAFALLNSRGGAARPTPSPLPPTAMGINPNATAVVIPTVTAPPSVAPATPVSTLAPALITATPTPVTVTLSILQPANVRSGPGTNYPAIGNLDAGKTVPLIGRDASGQWYAIQFGEGQGWVAGFLSNYTGDVNALPVIAAPPALVFTSIPLLSPSLGRDLTGAQRL